MNENLTDEEIKFINMMKFRVFLANAAGATVFIGLMMLIAYIAIGV